MFDSILVICTGNICRSPIGERILRNTLPSMLIDSAGTGALIDRPADESAIQIAQKYNINLDGHKARQFTAEMGRQYDLLLVMEQYHIEKVSRIAPEVRGKTMLLGHWMGGREIPDPYRKSNEAFDSVFRLIDQCCKHWADKLGR
ncbi:protein tyrosine phosphatase [Klebsiella pneumoniae]|uniref:protein-tyrosine-phosphatase n=1 Tax=Klebsiella pneumoniae TaxID=573 RepID=A0A483M7A2_KLEPN|nr:MULTISPECIES: protein tyrosine phosphatase [Klebsiella]HCI6871721.1 protein tyrosine phosphatase [Klebsiella variicola subsp. variicola]HDT2523837.1 protein tyrosine phosphatase [Klebsiella pneumoniae subsp. pneumoniae]AZV14088.1 protein tyrosine phosphatase [Klebsiella pneumoniae]EIX9463893.1 protein tyrosine phosphatase [Klebsiella pneumoniae]EKZ6231645.1 protein tyrosine phosphatase [Klebsiella variicola]